MGVIAPLRHEYERVSDAVLERLTLDFSATAEQYDRSAAFPRANFERLAAEGLIGLTVPKAYGGQGAKLVEGLRVLGAVAKGEPSTALILFMTYAYHAGLKTSQWPEHIYAELARDAVAGRGLIGGLRVEPELGTPVRGGLPKTTAVKTKDGWSLSGSKIYSTGSTGLDWFAVYARTDEPEPRVGTFLVRPDAPGIEILPAWDHLGMRATVSHEVVFTDTPLAADYAVDLRTPREWAEQPPEASAFLWNALAISTIYDGVARAARDWLKTYLNDRVPTNLGASLATLPRVQEKFGEIEALLYANRILIDDAARRADAGDPPSGVEGNTIKYLATANAIRAVEIGLELTGNPGLSRRNPLERHYRDVLCSRIHSPQTDTILTAAGKQGLTL
ncbi:acyl-CoA/acyl-ACP dehydrogenase [Asticcacaulis sp. BYS171W]|uniref:Acyl-CoA/acyl-ACP dehydrogenase n=1 Tax=Asticcacaulis aquaticus TaxID=2984212 RepID=A0ABT5HUV3_9CAUL|nr:acyl-CoA dehydrogenase family protein [Asticcacaulis aquaticus]MDC7683754.1 acyl-CoA/acyl-ACP dehydrogenase [Asticcacaulis aquaticus]